MTRRAAVQLYTSFREARPRKLIRYMADIPAAVAAIGHVEAIEYRTTHGKKLTLYRHDFQKGSRPLLCASGNGRTLLLLGGHFKFTDRGIVDRDSRGRLIYEPKHGSTINPRKRRGKNPVLKLGKKMRSIPLDSGKYSVKVWEERDRLHIDLQDEAGNTVADWWDEDARSMFEDGFFDRRDLQGSVIQYAHEMGLLKRRNPAIDKTRAAIHYNAELRKLTGDKVSGMWERWYMLPANKRAALARQHGGTIRAAQACCSE